MNKFLKILILIQIFYIVYLINQIKTPEKIKVLNHQEENIFKNGYTLIK